MGFILREGFDQYADTAEMHLADTFILGSAATTELRSDVHFGTTNGKAVWTNLTGTTGFYYRFAVAPLSGRNSVCGGMSFLIPDINAPFNSNAQTNPFFSISDLVELFLVDGILGDKSQIRVNAPGVSHDTGFNCLRNGRYYITVSMQGESSLGANDGRLLVKVNKNVVYDSGNSINWHATNLAVAQLNGNIPCGWASPSNNAAVFYGFDNLFMVDEFNDPDFFYIAISDPIGVQLNAWAEIGGGGTTLDRITDNSDGTYLFSNIPNDQVSMAFGIDPVFTNRTITEIALRGRMTNAAGGLTNAEVVIGDGVSAIGSTVESVAGTGSNYIEQVINVPISPPKKMGDISMGLIVRTP